MSEVPDEEKRRFKRIDTFIKVLIKVHSSDWQTVRYKVDGSVLNLSKDSFLIKMDRPLSEADRVSFLVYSKIRKIQYEIKGMVTQIRADGTVVMAMEIDPPEFIISDFIIDDMERNIDMEEDLRRSVDIVVKDDGRTF